MVRLSGAEFEIKEESPYYWYNCFRLVLYPPLYASLITPTSSFHWSASPKKIQPEGLLDDLEVLLEIKSRPSVDK